MTQCYDLVVLGAGPAGESAAELAAFFGHNVIIVEKNKPGGVVTTTGGAPTKTLRESMLALTGFYNREVYGITVSSPNSSSIHLAVDKIAERTRNVAELLQKVTAQNISKNGVEYLQGTAKISSDRKVLVNSSEGEQHELLAKNILVATGSRPFHPDNIPFEDPQVWDTDEFFSPGRQLPKNIFIVGGGPVGVEFATVFAGLGVPTTISDSSDRLIRTMDTEMSELIAKYLKHIGVDVILKSKTQEIIRINDGKLKVTLTNGKSFYPDAVLFAAGRMVNTDGLGLEQAGVELDDHGRIKVDCNYKTTADGIYAAGDVLGPSLASVAMEQGRIAACRMFGVQLKGVVDPTPVSAVYSMPEVAGVGLTEEQCKAQKLDYEVGRSDLSLIPRGAIAGHGGILKLIFSKNDRRLLGVHCFGDIASEIVGIGQMVIHFNGAINTFLQVTLNTPTYTYAYKYAAIDGIRKLGNDYKQKN